MYQPSEMAYYIWALRDHNAFFCHNFLCSHKFHKIANYFSFEVLKKKIWANFLWIIELFTQKIVNKLLCREGFLFLPCNN